ncbi:flagellar hook-basal body complex protein FliE [Nitrincola tibetensis]|uniref:Flagellar hook-basal body complex protein FliE n=1 Tax=Nitrincola tibetensis TaxID=2219697 RepID=A0A364NHP9_9GAMM|nr:flagellar hook-basal body complex protein FliE [Nitrincola tibetensis]RAU16574.1 flagellar hook-basal body complex protein FliE [Nitrincola tibetensis]
MIERADISSVLSQMRSLRAEMQAGAQQVALPSMGQLNTESVKPTDRSGFGALLKSAVDSVSEQQKMASELREAYERGDAGVDLPQVMIQAQKSSVAFDAMTQVRNRLVSAYEDISKMPI